MPKLQLRAQRAAMAPAWWLGTGSKLGLNLAPLCGGPLALGPAANPCMMKASLSPVTGLLQSSRGAGSQLSPSTAGWHQGALMLLLLLRLLLPSQHH